MCVPGGAVEAMEGMSQGKFKAPSSVVEEAWQRRVQALHEARLREIARREPGGFLEAREPATLSILPRLGRNSEKSKVIAADELRRIERENKDLVERIALGGRRGSGPPHGEALGYRRTVLDTAQGIRLNGPGGSSGLPLIDSRNNLPAAEERT